MRNNSPPGKIALQAKEHFLINDLIPRTGSPPRSPKHASPCFASSIPRFSKSDTVVPSPTAYNTNTSSFTSRKGGRSPFKSSTERFPNIRTQSPPSTTYQINYEFLEKKGQLASSSLGSTGKRYQFSPWENTK